MSKNSSNCFPRLRRRGVRPHAQATPAIASLEAVRLAKAGHRAILLPAMKLTNCLFGYHLDFFYRPHGNTTLGDVCLAFFLLSAFARKASDFVGRMPLSHMYASDVGNIFAILRVPCLQRTTWLNAVRGFSWLFAVAVNLSLQWALCLYAIVSCLGHLLILACNATQQLCSTWWHMALTS